MLQCVYSVVDHNWRQSVVRTKKWWSEPCGLNVKISASCDWSVAIFTMSLESQESCLTLRNLTLQITREFLPLHSTFARLYNAATSPASRLRSAGSLAIKGGWEWGALKSKLHEHALYAEQSKTTSNAMAHSSPLWDYTANPVITKALNTTPESTTMLPAC